MSQEIHLKYQSASLSFQRLLVDSFFTVIFIEVKILKLNWVQKSVNKNEQMYDIIY